MNENKSTSVIYVCSYYDKYIIQIHHAMRFIICLLVFFFETDPLITPKLFKVLNSNQNQDSFIDTDQMFETINNRRENIKRTYRLFETIVATVFLHSQVYKAIISIEDVKQIFSETVLRIISASLANIEEQSNLTTLYISEFASLSSFSLSLSLLRIFEQQTIIKAA